MALLAHGSARATLSLKRLENRELCVFHGQELDVKFKTADPIFLSFQLGYATYNFETTVRRLAPDGVAMECFYPRVIFYSEKRAVPREMPRPGLILEITLPAPYETKIQGPVGDLSENGASVLLEDSPLAFLKGTPLESIRILDGDRVLREGRGEIRYATAAEGEAEKAMKVGIQFGIGRMSIESIKEPPFEVFPDEPAETKAAPRRARRQSDFELRFRQAP
jgi:hypothetical protein